ncbi:hypothetical protein C9374_006858 [Naegleria lovaniensis]|uniref:F-box domain-containing protein n=1 Tax=Naegleria lovaniensis TaxID=51637 RepID=A0AA88H5X7_NAELO|nr:uncharacterized protein C9374_006858 [Naegleria lovaniensis]KAG2393327.1 hypothetical protein C9374_006858 [Naegleria lovaniensis]
MESLQHPDLLLCIFKNFNHIELCHCISRVNRLWYQISIRNELWRFLCFHVYSKHHGNFKTLQQDSQDEEDDPCSEEGEVLKKVNLKSNPDEFLNRNIVQLELENLYYKNKFFEKAYTNKLVVLRYPKEDLKYYSHFWHPPQANELKFTNDVKHLLKYVPINRKKQKNVSSKSSGSGGKKLQKKVKFELFENPSKEELLELLEFPGLITCSEMNRVHCVLNCCTTTKEKNAKRYTYDIVKKYVVKRSCPTLPMEQRWESVMNEHFSSFNYSSMIKMLQ